MFFVHCTEFFVRTHMAANNFLTVGNVVLKEQASGFISFLVPWAFLFLEALKIFARLSDKVNRTKIFVLHSNS